MPKKAKDEELNNVEKKTSTSKRATKKAETTKKTVENKSTSSPKKSTSTVKKTTTKKATSTAKKTTTKKATSTAKKTTTKKSTSAVKKTTTKKATSTDKKSTTKKSTSAVKKTTTKKSTSTTKKSIVKKVATPVEYYDLPSFYNKTVVKILAQTPSCLFVYWEISNEDRLSLEKHYGEGFFQDTKPYLLIINETKGYSFETEINDYANSWYIHLNDCDCKYAVKLIRKPINNIINVSEPFINIISSNEINFPNDHILFDRLSKTIFFKNVKTNIVTQKDISSIYYISNIGRIYNIYDLYKQIYKDELNGNELGTTLTSS